ncbi:MAG: heme biosynthesis protein HemY [Rhodospirillales bacterium]|nr:heme biosynthesis protein HemY [Rhodospirillales bacterium]
MIRIIAFVVAVIVVAAAATWISEPPGRVEIAWGDYMVETSPGTLAAAVAVAAAIVLVIAAVVRFVWIGPRRVALARRRRRERLGYRALTQGLVAAAAGDPKRARRFARRADALLEEPPLTLLLSAQAAQLEGDDHAARGYFEAMLDQPTTAFLGLRGLLVQAERTGDTARALELAEQAFALRPETPWVLTALLEMQTRAGRWSDALNTVKQALRHGAVSEEIGRRRQAGLLFERARALREQGEVKEALRVTDEARNADAAFLPAALLGAGLAKEAGRDNAAQRAVIDAWRHCPHPALGRLFLALHADSSTAEQRKRVETLVANNSDHAESLMLLANQALDAKQWGTARQHLERAAAECPSAGVYRLLARLEEAETGDGNAVRRRLQQASEAPPDPAWLCTRCASASPAWSIVCDRCGAFDSIEWRTPSRVEASALPPDTAAAGDDDEEQPVPAAAGTAAE